VADFAGEGEHGPPVVWTRLAGVAPRHQARCPAGHWPPGVAFGHEPPVAGWPRMSASDQLLPVSLRRCV